MLDHEVICEFSDLVFGVEETVTLCWSSKDDLEAEVEREAMLMEVRYNAMPRRRGKHRWEIREPGELLVVIRGRKVFEG